MGRKKQEKRKKKKILKKIQQKNALKQEEHNLRLCGGLPEDSNHRSIYMIHRRRAQGTPKQKKILNYPNTLRGMAESLKIPLKQWFLTLGAY